MFRLQADGKFDAAIRETAAIHDDTLLGDILAARYLNPAYHASPGQLRLWLRTFSGLADSPAIYSLLSSMPNRGGPLPPAPTHNALDSSHPPQHIRLPEEDDPSLRVFTRNSLLDHTVRERATQGVKGARSALHLIAVTPGINDLYAAHLQAEIAMTLFSSGENRQAMSIARDAFEHSGRRLGLAGYVAGLAAWRQGRPDMAEPLFEAASRASLTPGSIRAGAAYWAARAHQATGDVAAYHPWLHRAAAAPHTFYGLLASQILGLRAAAPKSAHTPDTIGPNAAMTLAAEQQTIHAGNRVLGEIDIEAVAATPAGRRAFALLQVGERDRAEATLRRMWPDIQNDAALCRSTQMVADAMNMKDLSAQMLMLIDTNESEHSSHDSRFPLPPLQPEHGFRMDPALVYALTRLESNFDTTVVSGAGARGLMQLMPVTAAFILHDRDRFNRRPVDLHDPAANLDIGQSYVLYLAQRSTQTGGTHVPPGGDMIRMLASYNAGPSAISRHNATMDDGEDPLLYIESLPNAETRDYVRRAFTYLWIYADKLGVPTPSLETLARNEWPGFDAEIAMASHTGHTIH
ncbi:lytic murein transglycosylase [Komagataeibacter europaeus NBRC 3261]|uniref:Lytic murein transglycosylase n=1 Tax=Komagataeibacter europaeus NBRC 3261 TaxID=1234669 RepID=A0A0D6Q1P4_KOMEU|nr:lytic murein transglycosylase [Komagataeibacter europaeus NBRC 3261]